MEQFKKEPASLNESYYLLSNKVLRDWKEYLDYASIIAEKKPLIRMSCKPSKVNEDLIMSEKLYLQYLEKGHPCSVILKPDLLEGKDYIIVNSDVWNFFSGKYFGIEVKRKGKVNENGKVVLVPDMHVVSIIPSLLF